MYNQIDLRSSTLCCLAGALLVGCSSGGDAAPDAPAGGPDAPAGGEAPYREALMPLVVGSYGGECRMYPADTPSTASIVVAPSGDVSAPGASGSLLRPTVWYAYQRWFEAGSVTKLSFTADDLGSSTGLYFGVGGGTLEGDNNARARQGVGNTSGLGCVKVPEALGLAGKALFPPVARFLVAPPRTLQCIVDGTRATSPRFEVTASEAILGDEHFSLTGGMAHEIVEVTTPTLLAYSVDTADGRTLTIQLDAAGALALVSMKDAAGVQTGCVP